MSPSAPSVMAAQSPPTSNDIPGSQFLPKDDLTQAAYSQAKQHLHPDILAHSIRVCLYAMDLSKKEGNIWHKDSGLPLLTTACLLHDIGTADKYSTVPIRFEVAGAEAAQEFLTQRGVSMEDAREVWIAIAMHTTPQIATLISPLARLVRLAVLTDFGQRDPSGTMTKEKLDQACPRGDIEKVLGDAVVAQAIQEPKKAPKHCWPGDLYQAKLNEQEYDGINKAF